MAMLSRVTHTIGHAVIHTIGMASRRARGTLSRVPWHWDMFSTLQTKHQCLVLACNVSRKYCNYRTL